MSIAILYLPLSVFLCLHLIVVLRMVIDGKVVVRPMMYVSLRYDHRMVVGRLAVSFLVLIKEFIEDPERIMMEV